jgi:hypothetical protein
MRRHDEDSRPPFGRGSPLSLAVRSRRFRGRFRQAGRSRRCPHPTARLPPAGARRTRVGFGPRVPPVPRPDRHHMAPLPRRGAALAPGSHAAALAPPPHVSAWGVVDTRRHDTSARARSVPFPPGESRACARGARALCLPHAPVRTRSPRPHHVAPRGANPVAPRTALRHLSRSRGVLW